MTELVGWRKYGHNELDEPRITNPKLYKLVDNSVPTPDVWCRQLTKAKGLIEGKQVKRYYKLDEEQFLVGMFHYDNSIFSEVSDKHNANPFIKGTNERGQFES